MEIQHERKTLLAALTPSNDEANSQGASRSSLCLCPKRKNSTTIHTKNHAKTVLFSFAILSASLSGTAQDGNSEETKPNALRISCVLICVYIFVSFFIFTLFVCTPEWGSCIMLLLWRTHLQTPFAILYCLFLYLLGRRCCFAWLGSTGLECSAVRSNADG